MWCYYFVVIALMLAHLCVLLPRPFMMRNGLEYFVFATAATVLLPFGAHAARSCDSATSGSFQTRLGDVRYDSPDPSKANGLSTIAASLQSSGGTPLYECVAQWPEAWAGRYEGGSNLIWADCIFTGAGTGQDDTVSFAVDWKSKTMYLAQTFTCSNKQGYLHALSFFPPPHTANSYKPDRRASRLDLSRWTSTAQWQTTTRIVFRRAHPEELAQRSISSQRWQRLL
jgi:hypothetical protein